MGRNSQVIQIANRFQFLNYIQSLLKSMKNQQKKTAQNTILKHNYILFWSDDELMINKNISYLLNNPNQKVVFNNIQKICEQ